MTAAQLVNTLPAVYLNTKFLYPIDKISLLLSVLSQKDRVEFFIFVAFRYL
jgi:hypothetical protein